MNKISILVWLVIFLGFVACNSESGDEIMTVLGPVSSSEIGTTLAHEHILVDFIGADSTGYHRWDKQKVVEKALPYLEEVRAKGCLTFIECTPAYVGRDPELMKILAEETGLNIITNTGFYGAGKNKFIPSRAFDMSPEELATEWIAEYQNGIEGTGIRPGFIKISVDGNDRLIPMHEKLIRAAAITHLETGLVIMSHTGPDKPALAQIAILQEMGVSPEAFIWTHAQAGTLDGWIKAAGLGAWISLDHVNQKGLQDYIDHLAELKSAGLLDRVIISHDSGWYRVGEKDGGNYNGYTTIFTELIPGLQQNGFDDEDINLLLHKNPARAFTIGVRTTDKRNLKNKTRFYVGSSDGAIEHSIFLCELDHKSGQVIKVDSFAGSRGSSYLVFSPDKEFLYAIDRAESDNIKKHNSVSSFKVADTYGRLKYINSKSSEGQGPCHISCHPDGSYIFIANYSEGNIAAYPLGDDGSISPASDIVWHTGSGPDPSRQTKAYAHHIMPDPAGKYILATDLGADKVFIYDFDLTKGQFTPNPAQKFFQTAPGAGPRHLDFHPTQPYVFIINELNGTLTSCSYDQQTGRMEEINTLSTLPVDFNGANGSAAVHVHPDGQFVYASNRGDLNSIAVFHIKGSGEIERIQIMEDVPAYPRDFNIDPQGKYLLVAGQNADEIEIFRIDRNNGKLSRTGQIIDVRAPACILFKK